ncbi:MAG: beta strand repeat-containing protein [Chryseobacterium sp.]
MKHLFTAAAMLFSMTAFAQVGINNTSPKATLDITAKTTDGSKPEGLIIPQLSGSNIHTATAAGIYGPNQKGLIIYATSADSSPISTTANITAAGYYYFDGTNWQKISTGNTVSTSLASGNILVGSASNVATAVSPTGDVTISNTGATSIGTSKVTTTHLANNAVTVAKLPAGATATTFLRGDGTWVTPTDTNTTYTAGTGLTLTGTSFSANDATTMTKGIIQLAGDLAGPVAAPTIASNAVTSAKIADGAVTASKLNQMSATSGQVLGWNGTAWAPTANGISTTLNNGNILVGNASNVATAVSPTGDVAISNAGITSIGTGKVTTTHLANNAVTVAKLPAGATATTFLRGDGTWVTPTDTNTTYTAGSGLTLTGTSFSANDATTGTKGIVQLSGDLTGTAAAPTVAKIQNKAVSSTAPTNGQVLKYNTTTSAWEPAADIDTNTTYTGSASINLNGTSFERTALSGDVTASANSNTTTIAANAVTSAKIADGTIANGDLDAGVGGIYKGNGALSGNTTVAQGGSTLAFTSTATNGFSVDGTTLSVDAANDRIGIGTAAPQARIHISGAGGFGGDHLRMTNSASDWALASENAGAQNGISGQASLTIVDRANTVRRMTIGTDNSFRLGGNIATGNSALSIDGATNNVGIGTNTPSAKLEINSGTANTSGLKFSNFNSSTTVGTGQALGVDASGNVITVPNSTAASVTTQEAFASSGSFNVNDLVWTTVSGSSQTITIPAGGKALFLNFMLGLDYFNFPAGGGTAYYTTKIYIDNSPTNVFQTAQESSAGAQAQFNLSCVKFLSAGTHTIDVRMSRTSNNGTTSGANMNCSVMSMSFNASYIN